MVPNFCLSCPLLAANAILWIALSDWLKAAKAIQLVSKIPKFWGRGNSDPRLPPSVWNPAACTVLLTGGGNCVYTMHTSMHAGYSCIGLNVSFIVKDAVQQTVCFTFLSCLLV